MKQGDVLTREQVDKLLGDQEDPIHSYVQGPAGVLIGADTESREELLAMADEGRVMRAGPTAVSMHHGLVYWENHEKQTGDRYVATVEEAS